MVNREKQRAYAAKWRDANRDKLKQYQDKYYTSEARLNNKENKRQQIKKRYLNEKYRIHVLVLAANKRAIKTGKGVDLEYLRTLEDDIPTACPCCKSVFDYTPDGSDNRKGPSLDRFDNSKGYVKGNVRIICESCNSKKSNMNEADLLMLLAYIRS